MEMRGKKGNVVEEPLIIQLINNIFVGLAEAVEEVVGDWLVVFLQVSRPAISVTLQIFHATPLPGIGAVCGACASATLAPSSLTFSATGST